MSTDAGSGGRLSQALVDKIEAQNGKVAAVGTNYGTNYM